MLSIKLDANNGGKKPRKKRKEKKVKLPEGGKSVVKIDCSNAFHTKSIALRR